MLMVSVSSTICPSSKNLRSSCTWAARMAVYDAHGNLTSVTSPAPNGNTAASVTNFAYDSKGELTTITDPLNHVTTMTYTAARLIATIKDAQNNVTTYGY